MNIEEIRKLLVDFKSQIEDEFRCYDDDDDKDGCPSMLVTIATDDGESWVYQTGDTQFHGACYHYRHWMSVCLCRASNCQDLARDAVEELRGLVVEGEEWEGVEA